MYTTHLSPSNLLYFILFLFKSPSPFSPCPRLHHNARFCIVSESPPNCPKITNLSQRLPSYFTIHQNIELDSWYCNDDGRGGYNSIELLFSAEILKLAHMHILCTYSYTLRVMIILFHIGRLNFTQLFQVDPSFQGDFYGMKALGHPHLLDIIGHWLDLMNIDGWIPREQILGAEALRCKVPEEFVLQHPTNGNPPTLFLVLHDLVSSLKRNKFTSMESNEISSFLERAFVRLEAWFQWFNTTQSDGGSNNASHGSIRFL
ncbi:Mannosyl-oligosaccharide glucosidase GCS1 [Vitis vinifera]|uniref:Mannosyl-oligosaccharide glucosidase GCS1 n=1 Tax=Vitis vinifera TaxID=29760 RepID=A0A438IRU2_VITVI|nr:Mannosyl-oligosaccharide glucosidase GCS1 [Vitis vinifera]